MFEQWALEQGFSIEREYDNSYRVETTDAAWGGWTAANVPMATSPALERVIAEQQATIDRLKKQVESGYETLNTMWTKHDELFDNFARLVDADIPKDDHLLKIDEYRRLRHACRLQMLEANYCMTCYNFVCECEGQYD
jgi:uncharacterized coiled-coil protein SlyX